jgi:PBP1b-binding outer membrane lipoprotein LpoB
MTHKKIIALLAGGALTLTALAGCGGMQKVTEPYNDAPRSNVQNGNAADIATFPDGFSNISTKCDHGNRVYVAFHGDSAYAAIAVVPQDPTCR